MRSFRKIDRFRCWVLALLYAMLAVFAPLLIYSTTTLWHMMDGVEVAAGLLIAFSVVTMVTSMKSLRTFLGTLQNSKGVPRLEVGPFFFMLVSLAIASRLFEGISTTLL